MVVQIPCSKTFAQKREDYTVLITNYIGTDCLVANSLVTCNRLV